MPTIVIEGIATRYEVSGSGPPLLMFSPGGFDAKLENWSSFSIYQRLRLLPHLSEKFTCITYDRRESGQSGGRLERIGWNRYTDQAKGLLDHLGIARAHIMGGCVGCSVAVAFGVAHRENVLSMVLYSPAGGPKYRIAQHDRFTQHLAYAEQHGLEAVVDLVQANDKNFSEDPRLGIWASVIRSDPHFAATYRTYDAKRYGVLVSAIARLLFDRDTVPGAEPEDLMGLDLPTLIVPGEDNSHAPSAARYLEECLSNSEYWDIPVIEQTEATAPHKVLAFLSSGAGH